jgi:hypothetical protein
MTSALTDKTYPMLVRDHLMERLKALPYFAGHSFHYHTNRSVQIQPESLPFAGVYFIEETNLPDGDANEGEVRFRCMARYGMSIIIQNNDSIKAESELDKAMNAINQMFTDPRIYNWEGKHGPAKIQAYVRGARTHQFGSVGAENEMPVAELRFDLTCDLGTITYDPPVNDWFMTMHVETRYPPGESDGVQQIVAQYDIPQGDFTKIRGTLYIKCNAVVI